jgi:hypothetical protein
VGSKWKDTEVTYELKHGKKKEKHRSKIGVKLTKELAKKKGVGMFGDLIGDEDNDKEKSPGHKKN